MRFVSYPANVMCVLLQGAFEKKEICIMGTSENSLFPVYEASPTPTSPPEVVVLPPNAVASSPCSPSRSATAPTGVSRGAQYRVSGSTLPVLTFSCRPLYHQQPSYHLHYHLQRPWLLKQPWQRLDLNRRKKSLACRT